MQKRARNLAAEELLIEVMESRSFKFAVKLRFESLKNDIKIISLLLTFGWGRANRGINFSYVLFCTF